jgi:hypothetical protein
MKKNEDMEQRVKNLFMGVKATNNNSLKSKLMVEAGDLRREQYLMTEIGRQKDHYRKMSSNCYQAARNFHYRGLGGD